jgi:hypothetical protein
MRFAIREAIRGIPPDGSGRLERGGSPPESAHVHGHEELGVALGLAETGSQKLHRLDDVHVRDDLAQSGDELVLLRVEEKLLATGARGGDVDRGVDPLLDELAVEVELGCRCRPARSR